MIDLTKEFSDLYELVKDVPNRKLRVCKSEERADDLGSLLLPEFEMNDISLFQKTSSGGFVEKELLSKEELEKLINVRKKLKDNPKIKDILIKSIEKHLNMKYDKFKILSLGFQEHLIYTTNKENSHEDKVLKLK